MYNNKLICFFERLLGPSHTILDGFWTKTSKLKSKFGENPIVPLSTP